MKNNEHPGYKIYHEFKIGDNDYLTCRLEGSNTTIISKKYIDLASNIYGKLYFKDKDNLEVIYYPASGSSIMVGLLEYDGDGLWSFSGTDLVDYIIIKTNTKNIVKAQKKIFKKLFEIGMCI